MPGAAAATFLLQLRNGSVTMSEKIALSAADQNVHAAARSTSLLSSLFYFLHFLTVLPHFSTLFMFIRFPTFFTSFESPLLYFLHFSTFFPSLPASLLYFLDFLTVLTSLLSSLHYCLHFLTVLTSLLSSPFSTSLLSSFPFFLHFLFSLLYDLHFPAFFTSLLSSLLYCLRFPASSLLYFLHLPSLFTSLLYSLPYFLHFPTFFPSFLSSLLYFLDILTVLTSLLSSHLYFLHLPLLYFLHFPPVSIPYGSGIIPQTACPHWGVLTVGVKAGAWSRCSLWSAAFYLEISVKIKWLLWNLDMRFNCPGSHKVCGAVLVCGFLPVNSSIKCLVLWNHDMRF
jgi:hypothetical protein